jgi:hypothetical protein
MLRQYHACGVTAGKPQIEAQQVDVDVNSWTGAGRKGHLLIAAFCCCFQRRKQLIAPLALFGS